VDGCLSPCFTPDEQPTTNKELVTFFGLLSDDGLLSDLDKGFFRALDDKTRVFDLLDLSDDATIGDDLIINLQLRDHVLKLLTLLFLGKDHEEVKDPEDEHEREQSP
jgi:hypothetical protein